VSYICPSCGEWVADNVYHYCTNQYYTNNPSYWNYPWYSTTVNRIVKCRKKECIYWSSERYVQNSYDLNGYCGNNSLLMDEDGKCRCFVKRNSDD
jgi:hypothetical protein